MNRRTIGVAVAFLVMLAAPSQASAKGLTLGFMEQGVLEIADPSQRAAGLQNARAAGARIMRFGLYWSDVAPTKPPTMAAARDPSWPGYRWDRIDQFVRSIAKEGLVPLPFVFKAPPWAEGRGRPVASKSVPAGTWRPSAKHFEAFATALATRYSGTHPDPLTAGARLPAITDWQVWNEPNLSVDLNPQWRKTSRGLVPESPRIYRSLLNAFYRGTKRVDMRNRIVTAGTAPYGDLKDGDPRIPPLRWWRSLLCLEPGQTSQKCPRVWFDAAAHHPYPIGPPRRKARNADDAVVPDVWKVRRVIARGVSGGTIRPRASKPIWATEISWDSFPDPDGLSLAQHATYLQGALNVLYEQGVAVVLWFNLRDNAPRPSYAATLQSGVFLRGPTPAQDVPKPSFTAFRFPFTAYRTRGVARLWGMAPAGGTVTIQARSGDRWVTATRLRAKSNRIFSGRLRVGQGVSLRAVWNSDTSLVWRTF